MTRSNATRNVKRVKQPWWYVTKTEAQAFWLGGCQAALALFGWVGVATGGSHLPEKVFAVGWTLLAAATLTSGVVRHRLSARSADDSR
jgi:hypothetical protein